MSEINASDLRGAHLDAAVARCEGWLFCEPEDIPIPVSTDWDIAGPILERERIGLAAQEDGSWSGYFFDHAAGAMVVDCAGPTPLVAGLRAYVARKLGAVVSFGGADG